MINFKLLSFLICSVAILLCQTGNCQTTVHSAPAANLAINDAETNVGVGLEKCFERLRFQRPILLTHAGDGSDRIFIVEQGGKILVFENGQSPTTSKVFLDISAQVSREGNEEGLLGLAFHPEFENNGQFFVYYSSKHNDMHSVVSRYNVRADDADQADPESEKIILTQLQPYRNHNGGDIKFGHDGFLYISFGDGGSANDPHSHGQNLQSWLGSILRIDVDRQTDGKQYSIPSDNPFVETAKSVGDQNAAPGPKAAPEIWAYGLRNVWRFSFDRQTGQLWAADVGQNETEEVNIITAGGNYGWNHFEANKIFKEETSLARGTAIPPVATYHHDFGLSITGGHVYRGQQFPELKGLYFYADYVSGNLWSLRKTESEKYESTLVRRTGRSIACFGEDQSGEVYVCSFDGYIYRVVPSEKPADVFAKWDQQLSQTGIFSSLKDQKVSQQYSRYEVNAPFWSDNAIKHRYFKVPPGTSLGYQESGTWSIPVGTQIVKHFQNLDKKPIETRLIERTEDGWEAATYVWNTAGEEAELLPQGKQFELWQPVAGKKNWSPITWHAPSASECASCHTDAAGYVLGMNTAQLNRAQEGKTSNQILKWIEEGLVDLDVFDSENAPKYCNPYDESADLETRARVLLEVNCAMCHRPNGPGNANIDLRYETANDQTKMINVPPAQSDHGDAGDKILKPGYPEKSTLWQRMETLGRGRMPTIGSSVVDKQGVDLIGQWIESLAR